ncbi:Protein ARABIDILLO 1 [Raphanus sativus]|nr:Protein ARABIDILLO 1 [Raphanus sativus]
MPKDTMRWLEWNLSRTLLHLAEKNLIGLNTFWHNHGPKLFLRLMQSSQEDVQESAAIGLASFIHMGDDNVSISVMCNGGIPILLKFAKSWKESFQSEAARAIPNLSLHDNAAKAVARRRAKSTSRLVAQEAAGALWHLSLGDAYKPLYKLDE